MNEITAALHLIAAGWPGKIEPAQLDLWRAAITEHAERVPAGTITKAAKNVVVLGGPWPPSLSDFLAEMLGLNDIEDANTAWLTAHHPPQNELHRRAQQAAGGQWEILHTTMMGATRKAFVETYNAELERLRRDVLLGNVDPPAQIGDIEMRALPEWEPPTEPSRYDDSGRLRDRTDEYAEECNEHYEQVQQIRRNGLDAARAALKQ